MGVSEMKKCMFLALLLCLGFAYGDPGPVHAQTPAIQQDEPDGNNPVEPYGGRYRSPRRSYNPGITDPNRAAPARRPDAVTPDPRYQTPQRPGTPAAPARPGWGSFFGGLALGTILGSLFNPFAGFHLGFPLLSFISLGLWVLAIWLIYRTIRRMRGSKSS